MNTKRRNLFAALALALIAALAYAYANVEWTTHRIDTGYSALAQQDRFLAAKRFLASTGVAAKSSPGLGLLDALPSSDDSLLITSNRSTLSARRVSALQEWVEAGGQLIVLASEVYDLDLAASGDDFLDDVGIFLLEVEVDGDRAPEEAAGETQAGAPPPDPLADDAATAGHPESDDSSAAEETRSERLGDFFAELDLRPLAVCEEHREHLNAIRPDARGELLLELGGPSGSWDDLELSSRDDDYLGSSDAAPQVAAVSLGAGRVVALTSLELFHNERIHCHDHGLALLSIAARPRLWIMDDPVVPSITEHLWRTLPATTLAVLAGVVLFAGSRSLRFGRAPMPAESARRESLEHLAASVQFRWRAGALAPTLARIRAAYGLATTPDNSARPRRGEVIEIARQIVGPRRHQ